MRPRLESRRSKLLALLTGIVVAGALVVGYIVFGGEDEIDKVPENLIDTEALRSMAADGKVAIQVEVDVESPVAEPATFDGEVVVDIETSEASGRFDMTAIPNAAGVFGSHEELQVAYEGYVAFFHLEAPIVEWLEVDVEGASPRMNADIGSLREATLCGPSLVLDVIRAAPEASTAFVLRTRNPGAAVSDGFGATADVLRKAWLIKEVSVEVVQDSDSTDVIARFEYPVVPTSQDNVIVRCRYTMTPTDEEPELPDDSEIMTYEELAS